ncbi:UvrB/UvrC motif-containing protein [Anaerosalibacter massiliensis]|uniref:UvrB/UvrC motif-containing protein n=1 Tax=Anaerosalibacter massiliensis TaxID=1347392 RepID=A0A9X2MHU7_9FIRM|nr:UvrB/UvrC motif-containing protein [Anaerosalibacter massiliensis]MCR2045427.1 UvrB/UvrC motif-containing protein [Anaerosalibacter massiliensis]
MVCQECGKKSATMHFTKIINGDITELHLCEDCAKRYKEFDFDTSFSFHKFLTGLIDNIQGEPVKTEGKELKCDVCGMSYSNFKQIGKFGCPHCYESFKSKLVPLFREVHGHGSHIGKIPKRAGGVIGLKKEINKLKNKLDILVKNEEFEEAAKVRDQIKEIQKDIENN